MTFAQWMAAVNAAVEHQIGMSTDDLPDCLYRDWFDDGVDVDEAAEAAIDTADYGSDYGSDYGDEYEYDASDPYDIEYDR